MIVNRTRQTVIAAQVKKADNPFLRMKGLLGKKFMPENYALVIIPCNSIHMFFMHFAIDVMFVDKKGIVVGLCEAIKPNALSPIFWESTCAIELPLGTIAKTQTCVGDQIQIGN